MTNQVSISEPENPDPFAQLDTVKNQLPKPPLIPNQQIEIKPEHGMKQDHIEQISESFNNIPDLPFESNNDKPQRQAQQIQNDFPQKPKAKLMIPEIFSNYDVDTLFYIFFFFPGTPQQYFAGRELQKMGWIFSSQSMTWIHPNTDQKSGLVDYFDKDKWEIVKMTNFKLDPRK